MQTLRLDTSQITSKETLNNAMGALMDYPGWHDDNIVSWLDFVTVGQRSEPSLDRFRKAKREMFIIEVQESLDFFERKRNLFKEMMQTITAINEFSEMRIGYPLITLTLQ